MVKTLDEVIEAIEVCRDSYVAGKIIKSDALHYLKEYRKLDSLDAVAFPEDDNPALSWDELREMEGKPVWVEYISCKRKVWAIVDCFYTDAFGKVKINVALPHDYWNLERELMGKTWQAYRKER